MDATPIDRRTIPAGMTFSAWRAPDGWQHRRMAWPQPTGVAPRGALLMAGGRGDFVEKSIEALTHWHRRGWDIAGFDWRGQGKSKGNIKDGNLNDFTILVDDLAALVADWRGATPAPHVVVGHSMGGHLLLRLLVERRPAIDAAVLTSPMIEVNSAPLPQGAAAAVARLATRVGFGDRPLWTVPLAPAPVGSRRQTVLTSSPDRYADEPYWWDVDADFRPAAPSFGWIDAAFRSARSFTRERLAGVTTPVLIVATERDRLVSPVAIRRAASLFPAAELALFNDSAHEILREREPIRSAALARIDAFLDERSP